MLDYFGLQRINVCNLVTAHEQLILQMPHGIVRPSSSGELVSSEALIAALEGELPDLRVIGTVTGFWKRRCILRRSQQVLETEGRSGCVT